ncbi:MAG: NAD(P)H-dependent oxidoreductase, partial [Turicibacter sp.]
MSLLKIAVINGSPKGKYSFTIQSVEYLKKCFPQCEFEILHVGKYVRKFETKDGLQQTIETMKQSDLILFAYPVYSAVAPYQLHKFIDAIKAVANEDNFKGKLMTQLTTSKHFYDMTAHQYVEQNSTDLGLKILPGLSADMEDLLCEKGRAQLIEFWNYVTYAATHDLFEQKIPLAQMPSFTYNFNELKTEPIKKFDTLILTNCEPSDMNLQRMIADFQHVYTYQTRVINIRDFKFLGGCLGCLNCASDGACIYKDGFETFLREQIQTADAIIYAATIKNHYIGTDFKLFNDRHFCDGHRTATMGMPVGYLLSGQYSKEHHLINILEGRSEVSHHFMLGVVSDESLNDAVVHENIRKLAGKTAYALENKISLPQNFLGVGGSKIFRDLIYMTGGLMRED